MATIIEIDKVALDLPERHRATLIANLLHSLPPVLEDVGTAEALRRDAEMDADPTLAISSRHLTLGSVTATVVRLELHPLADGARCKS